MESKPTEKKMERISKQQKQKLVDYMSSHLEFARGQVGGANAGCNYKEQWESLRITLNSMGGSDKTVEQWKKCWIDLKLGVRKIIKTRKKIIYQTGCDNWEDVHLGLKPLEEQILQIMTVHAADRDSCTPEDKVNIEEPYVVNAVDGNACTPETTVKLEEPFEEFDSVKYSQSDEMYAPAVKKSNTNHLQPTPSISYSIKIEEPFEEFGAAEYSESEEIYAPPVKKSKTQNFEPTPSTSCQAFQRRKLASSSKYTEALDEARAMQTAVIEKLNTIEKQNLEILEKLNKVLNSSFNN